MTDLQRHSLNPKESDSNCQIKIIGGKKEGKTKKGGKAAKSKAAQVAGGTAALSSKANGSVNPSINKSTLSSNATGMQQ